MKIKSSRLSTHLDLLALRQGLGLSQQIFWGRIGVTQGCGSCYEADGLVPPPVAMLLELVYVRGIALEQIETGDIAVLRHIREDRPDLYTMLSKAVGSTAASAQKP